MGARCVDIVISQLMEEIADTSETEVDVGSSSPPDETSRAAPFLQLPSTTACLSPPRSPGTSPLEPQKEQMRLIDILRAEVNEKDGLIQLYERGVHLKQQTIASMEEREREYTKQCDHLEQEREVAKRELQEVIDEREALREKANLHSKALVATKRAYVDREAQFTQLRQQVMLQSQEIKSLRTQFARLTEVNTKLTADADHFAQVVRDLSTARLSDQQEIQYLRAYAKKVAQQSTEELQRAAAEIVRLTALVHEMDGRSSPRPPKQDRTPGAERGSSRLARSPREPVSASSSPSDVSRRRDGDRERPRS
jgi:hypothetical protein